MVRLVRLAGYSAHDADTLLRRTVADAIEHGATWAEIGEALNINAETAAKRFQGARHGGC